MDEILLTSACTVLGGVIVLVMGQITLKFVVEPILEQSRFIGLIAHNLVMYANVYPDSPNAPEAKEAFRLRASELMSATYNIKGYFIWSTLRVVQKRGNIIKASAELVGMSNSPGSRDNEQRRKDIARYLGIKIISEKFGG